MIWSHAWSIYVDSKYAEKNARVEMNGLATVTVTKEMYEVGKKHGITPRTQKLREMIVTKSIMGEDFKDPRVQVDVEKLRYYTQSWKQTENMSTVLRRAKAVERVLDNVTIFINDLELLVSYPGSTPGSIYMSPERPRKVAEELDALGHVPAVDKKELHELLDYWTGKGGQDRMRTYFTDEEWAIYEAKSLIWTLGADYTQRAAPHWERILQLGLNGIIKQIEEKLTEAEKEIRKPENATKIPELMKNIDFLNP